jgi:AcrR family transcriptional regulator
MPETTPKATPEETPRSATRRADAERNRAKILAAARGAFVDPEAEVSMAEVARRAGVGMATLYRNFPGRRELLEALYLDEVDALCASVETLAGDDPGDRLDQWLRRFFAFFRSKRHLADELLKNPDGGTRPFFDANKSRVFSAGAPLLDAAQRAGEVRGDLSLEQILELVIAVAKIAGEPAHLEPILQTALDGLRPR